MLLRRDQLLFHSVPYAVQPGGYENARDIETYSHSVMCKANAKEFYSGNHPLCSEPKCEASTLEDAFD
jgi:hypothetical protein